MTNETTDALLSEQDKADIETLNSDEPLAIPEPKPHTLLEVWSEIMSNIETSRTAHIDPAEATRILRSWSYLKFQEIPRYSELFFDRLSELRALLDAEIAADPDALNNVDDDAEDNRAHYLNLLLGWQLLTLVWSEEWDCTDAEAHIQVAAIADAQNFVLGERGLVAQLEVIQFEYTDDEAQEINALLLEYKEGR